MNTNGTAENVHEQIVALLPRLRRFARNLTRNPHDADDVLQTGYGDLSHYFQSLISRNMCYYTCAMLKRHDIRYLSTHL